MMLKEDSELYRGIFWIIDIDNPYSSKNYCFKIPTDIDGNPTDTTDYSLNAKSGNTYNHKLLWERLPKYLTKGKPYNYYPRGRVEIKGGKARIFLNGNINTEDVIGFLEFEFNLSPHNGIKMVSVIEDNSTHYLCYLDDGWKADR